VRSGIDFVKLFLAGKESASPDNLYAVLLERVRFRRRADTPGGRPGESRPDILKLTDIVYI